MAKTRKSIKKRFKITKTGKVLRKSAGQNHYRGKKSGKRIRKIRKSFLRLFAANKFTL